MGRVALISAGNWSPGYWGDAAQWAAYTKNRVPHQTLKEKCPIQVFLNKEVNRGNLRPFVQKVNTHIYTETNKMSPRATPACILGYTETYGIYQVISPTGKRLLSKNPTPIKEDMEEETVLPFDSEEEKPPFEMSPTIPEPLNTPVLGTPERSITPTFDTPDNQLLQEAQRPPDAPRRKKITEEEWAIRGGSRKSTRISDKRIPESDARIARVGHDKDHPTDEQARASNKNHEWSKARQVE